MFQCTKAELENIWQREKISEQELSEIIKESISLPIKLIDDKFPFNDHYFDLERMKKIASAHKIYEGENKVVETVKLADKSHIFVVKQNGEIIEQYLFNAKSNVLKTFECTLDGSIAKMVEDSKTKINFYDNHLETVHMVEYKEIKVLESYTLRKSGDIIKTTIRGNRTQTAILYTNGDWYYTSSEGGKTIIIGKNNYQNKIRQIYSNGMIIGNEKIMEGILMTDKVLGNNVHIQDLSTNLSKKLINNGIITDAYSIAVNGYPKCLGERPRSLFTEFDYIDYPRKYTFEGFVICITRDRTMYRTAHWKIIKEILSADTQWDYCCLLYHISYMKNIYWEKNNNLVEYEADGNVRHITDLGAVYKYVNDENRIIWNKQKLSSGNSSASRSSDFSPLINEQITGKRMYSGGSSSTSSNNDFPTFIQEQKTSKRMKKL